jgi:AcrR family transcriptional regulator
VAVPDTNSFAHGAPVGAKAARIGRRERNKNAIRTRITDDLIRLISEGLEIRHDLISKRTGISRRTVYRYFPDRESLLESAWDCVAQLGFHHVLLPRSEEDLTEQLHEVYTGLDRIAPIATFTLSTPLGRAIRRASNKRRIQSYTAAAQNAVKHLPPQDRKLATALLQALHASPWLEMREHWGLTGEQMARATKWAIRTLLNDLHLRGSTPLDTPLHPRMKPQPRTRRKSPG